MTCTRPRRSRPATGGVNTEGDGNSHNDYTITTYDSGFITGANGSFSFFQDKTVTAGTFDKVTDSSGGVTNSGSGPGATSYSYQATTTDEHTVHFRVTQDLTVTPLDSGSGVPPLNTGAPASTQTRYAAFPISDWCAGNRSSALCATNLDLSMSISMAAIAAVGVGPHCRCCTCE